MTKKYDLFISYKQSNGAQLALIVKLLLEKKNLNIFLDEDNLDDLHDLEKFVKKSENILLIITEGVFEREFVIKELETALKYKINIITLWDKNGCPDLPKKDILKKDISSILNLKAIIWFINKNFRDNAINEIIKKMEKSNDRLFNFILPNEFKIIEINEDMNIKKIMEINNIQFKTGSSFYQLTKNEKISTNKEIILVCKKTRNMFNGENVRSFLKLKSFTNIKGDIEHVKYKSVELERYDIFIQSASYNRKILKGTKFLISKY